MIKKFILLFIINIFLATSAISYDLDKMPEYSETDLTENIKDHGFRIMYTNIAANENYPIEIITLEKAGWILKCRLRYTSSLIQTFCTIP